MRKQFSVFLLRWLLNSFGLWIAVHLLGSGIKNDHITAGLFGYLLAGLIFSVVNSVLRPIVVIFSLPAILLTLGLFTFVVNGAMVYVSLLIAPGLKMSFMYSILTGIILSLVNYIVSSALELRSETAQKEYK